MSTVEKLSPVIPVELARYISPEQITENAANHIELQREYTPAQHLAISAIKDMLLDIPLTHGTNKPVAHFVMNGIIPESQLDRDMFSSHTERLDRSIGMNRYTFMHWGDFSKSSYGRTIIGIDPKQILLSNNTIVSPHDINATMYSSLQTSANELDDDARTKFDTHLSTIVSGSDWLEITARRYVNLVLNDSTKAVHPLKYMGEIKHFGAIQPEVFTGIAATNEDHQAKWKDLLEQGFMPQPVENAIPHRTNDYDRSPEDLGADIAKARSAWAKIIDLANS